MGGYLTTLDTWDEVDWMKGYRSRHPPLRDETWVGGRKIGGVWYWIAELGNMPITTLDWAPGEPGLVYDGHCIQLAGDTGYWAQRYTSWFKFDDSTWEALHYFICEHDILIV